VFLDVKAGYCVHYASAMTLMARTLGIPARIAVGFLPGVRNPDVPSEYVVSTDDLHAWPELHFDDIGWVRFEPTPSRGAVPEYASAEVPAPDEVPEIDPETGEPVEAEPDSDPATPDPETDPIDRVVGPTDAPDAGDLIDGGHDGFADGAGERGTLDGGTDARALAAALFALLVALVITPAIWRVLRRSSRLRSSDPLDHWREARDTARDLGLSADPEQTPRQLAVAWAAEWTPEDRLRLDALREALENRAFAGGDLPSDPDQTTVGVVRALRRSAPAWARVLARIAPVSLLDRTPHDERFLVEPAAPSRAPGN
jgi:hypothetical protein